MAKLTKNTWQKNTLRNTGSRQNAIQVTDVHTAAPKH